ncbi:MAG: nucleotidyltransferase domain-containing protein [Nanoarchaeota archaeon]
MDKAFKNNGYMVLELFIKHPVKDFSVRGIARDLGMSHATVLSYIGEIERLGLVRKNSSTLYPTYYANTEGSRYRMYKRDWLIFLISESGLINHVQSETFASSIVLFGSGAKATFTENSDIDIFVEAKEKKLNLSKYERKLGHKVNLLFDASINNLSRELRNNIINGIVFYGFIRI